MTILDVRMFFSFKKGYFVFDMMGIYTRSIHWLK